MAIWQRPAYDDFEGVLELTVRSAGQVITDVLRSRV